MDTTEIRRIQVIAMVVGPSGETAEKIAAGFERERVEVVRVGHAAAACERLAVAMPHVVVVLGTLHPEERDAMADRATAVGAIVMYVDPELDDATLDELVAGAARAALERKLRRDESGTDEDDVDSNW